MYLLQLQSRKHSWRGSEICRRKYKTARTSNVTRAQEQETLCSVPDDCYLRQQSNTRPTRICICIRIPNNQTATSPSAMSLSPSSSPKIHRPKPRRPYESTSSFTNQPPSPHLSPSYPDDTPSRTHSILNLTSSTLLGIYSPTGYQPSTDFDYSQPSTPWGTGAETPRTNSISDPVPVPIRRTAPAPAPPPSSTRSTVSALALRGVLLFGIGMGYGVLVRHLHDDRQLAPFQVEGIIKPRNDWRYLVFWGVAGVCLGSLMPWVDTLFSPASPAEEASSYGEKRATSSAAEKEQVEEESGLFGADWTPVVRSVGAFVGIAYAIVCLPPFLFHPARPHPNLPPPNLQTANTLVAKTSLGHPPPSLPNPLPRQPRPLVPNRPLRPRIHPLCLGRRSRYLAPPSLKPRHDALSRILHLSLQKYHVQT